MTRPVAVCDGGPRGSSGDPGGDGPGIDRGTVVEEDGRFPWRTSLGNVPVGLERWDVDRATRRTRARESLEIVGPQGIEAQWPHERSGGMKQRVGNARPLAVDPDVLPMDEPSASVESRTRSMLHDGLLRLRRATGKTVRSVTHDVDEAVTLADRPVVLSGAPGTVADVVDVDLDRPRRRTAEAFDGLRTRVRERIADG